MKKKKLAGWLTDGGDVRGIKFTFREPAQHAGLPDAGVPEHEQPGQHVVLFGHDPELRHGAERDSSMQLPLTAVARCLHGPSETPASQLGHGKTVKVRPARSLWSTLTARQVVKADFFLEAPAGYFAGFNDFQKKKEKKKD